MIKTFQLSRALLCAGLSLFLLSPAARAVDFQNLGSMFQGNLDPNQFGFESQRQPGCNYQGLGGGGDTSGDYRCDQLNNNNPPQNFYGQQQRRFPPQDELSLEPDEYEPEPVNIGQVTEMLFGDIFDRLDNPDDALAMAQCYQERLASGDYDIDLTDPDPNVTGSLTEDCLNRLGITLPPARSRQPDQDHLLVEHLFAPGITGLSQIAMTDYINFWSSNAPPGVESLADYDGPIVEIRNGVRYFMGQPVFIDHDAPLVDHDNNFATPRIPDPDGATSTPRIPEFVDPLDTNDMTVSCSRIPDKTNYWDPPAYVERQFYEDNSGQPPAVAAMLSDDDLRFEYYDFNNIMPPAPPGGWNPTQLLEIGLGNTPPPPYGDEFQVFGPQNYDQYRTDYQSAYGNAIEADTSSGNLYATQSNPTSSGRFDIDGRADHHGEPVVNLTAPDGSSLTVERYDASSNTTTTLTTDDNGDTYVFDNPVVFEGNGSGVALINQNSVDSNALPPPPAGSGRLFVLEDVHISNPDGPCLELSNFDSVVINNVTFGPCGGPALVINGGTNIEIEDSHIEFAEGGIEINSPTTATSTINIAGNSIRDLQGPQNVSKGIVINDASGVITIENNRIQNSGMINTTPGTAIELNDVTSTTTVNNNQVHTRDATTRSCGLVLNGTTDDVTATRNHFINDNAPACGIDNNTSTTVDTGQPGQENVTDETFLDSDLLTSNLVPACHFPWNLPPNLQQAWGVATGTAIDYNGPLPYCDEAEDFSSTVNRSASARVNGVIIPVSPNSNLNSTPPGARIADLCPDMNYDPGFGFRPPRNTQSADGETDYFMPQQADYERYWDYYWDYDPSIPFPSPPPNCQDPGRDPEEFCYPP